MRSTLLSEREMQETLASAADRLLHKMLLAGDLIVDITEVLGAHLIYVSMRITPMDSEKSATVTEQAVQLTTESASLPESGWDVSKPLNPIVYRISGSATN